MAGVKERGIGDNYHCNLRQKPTTVSHNEIKIKLLFFFSFLSMDLKVLICIFITFAFHFNCVLTH